MGMCRCMGSHFHDWIDYNGVSFSIVTRMGWHMFGILGIRKLWCVGIQKWEDSRLESCYRSAKS